MRPKTESLQLPYAHLNLRWNPFGELPLAEWPALAHVDLENIVNKLTMAGSDKYSYAVQFIGDKGNGKTTHLLSIKAIFPNAGYVHIPEGERAAVPDGHPVLIDEAQRLTYWQRRKLFRSNRPLVLATHQDYTRELRRAGRQVETLEVRLGTTPARIHRLLNRRIQHASRSDGPVPAVSYQTAERLMRAFGTDIRAILHQMYTVFQSLSDIDEV